MFGETPAPCARDGGNWQKVTARERKPTSAGRREKEKGERKRRGRVLHIIQTFQAQRGGEWAGGQQRGESHEGNDWLGGEKKKSA